MDSLATSPRARFGAALRVPEFRALWVAEAQSLAGDQLARVALSVLVFSRTGSAALTALTYALTFLPAIVGGALLSGLADRVPRRALMVRCDLLRAGLLAAMAVPNLPLAVLCLLLVAAVLTGQPFLAAQSAMLPSVLPGELYVGGSGLRMVTDQIAQLAGFGAGGAVIAVIGARAGLLVDAATFCISALVLRLFVAEHPVDVVADETPDHARRDRRMARGLHRRARRRRFALDRLAEAARGIWAEPRLRTLLGLGWLAGLHVVPEGVAVPYAHALGGGATAAGVLMAALPAGSAVGAAVVVRLPEAARSALIGPLAVAVALPLLACALRPGLGVSVALWAVSGLCAGYHVQAAALFVRLVPDTRRGQTVGLASSGVVAAQGLGILVFGVIADYLGAAGAVALAGAVSLLLGVVLATIWARLCRAE